MHTLAATPSGHHSHTVLSRSASQLSSSSDRATASTVTFRRSAATRQTIITRPHSVHSALHHGSAPHSVITLQTTNSASSPVPAPKTPEAIRAVFCHRGDAASTETLMHSPSPKATPIRLTSTSAVFITMRSLHSCTSMVSNSSQIPANSVTMLSRPSHLSSGRLANIAASAMPSSATPLAMSTIPITRQPCHIGVR